MVIENRAARHEYYIEDTIECGIQLLGNEVKSIRAGKASIKEAWVQHSGNNLTLKQMHISKWETANLFDIQESRERSLLVHKAEARKLGQLVQKAGYTLIPLKVYFNERNKCKVLVGLCKGKNTRDKREDSKARDIKKEISRAMKQYN